MPKYAFNAKELDEETGMYYYEARYYKQPVFTSRDPMFEKYFWMTPYAYCANNPVKYVDPDGEEIGDYYSSTGQYIGNDGIDDNRIYQAKEGGEIIFGLGVLQEYCFEYVGDVDETILKYEGTMYERSTDDPLFDASISVGNLNIVQKVGDKEFVKESYGALSGGWGNGSIQNGEYNVNHLRDNRTGSYCNHDVGFTFDVIPTFVTCRDLLRIHPDGGTKGTKGCIGLTGDANELKNFRNSLNNLLNNASSIKLNVIIDGNPNRDGCPSNKK